MRHWAGAAPLVMGWVLPFLAGLAMAIASLADVAAWRAVLIHPQTWPGLGLSLWTGTASTLAALICMLTISSALYRSRVWNLLQVLAAGSLAIPHLAFAIGFGFLIMPSGWLLRLFVGGAVPPQWVTVQDPYGLSLIAALALKETPFLLAMAWSVLSQGDTAQALKGQWRAAVSLGHAPGSIWFRVIQPQLLRRLMWPIIIVWIYGTTVVDMALVIGPTQPPTLAVTLWRNLNDADPAINAQGLAGTLFLTTALVLAGTVVPLLARASRGRWRQILVRGPSPLAVPARLATALITLLVTIYGLTIVVLAVMSAAPRWAYPALWPDTLSVAMWSRALADASPLLLSLGLGVATTLAAIVSMLAWLETQPEHRDRWLLAMAVLALGLPQILTAAGQYRAFLRLDLTGSLTGLFLTHLTQVAAYAAIVLARPYRALDPRFAAAARALRAGPAKTLLRIKVPLLKAPLLTTSAVCFSVSMLQFVPAQLMASGRFSTLPMDVVTTTAGGNRALTAAFALVLTIPPLTVFAAAALFGRPRWR